jgi:hypothetical protein
MIPPKIVIEGDEAYLPSAKDCYRKLVAIGGGRKAAVFDNTLVVVEARADGGGKILLLDLLDRFYVIYMNISYVRDDPRMIADIGRNTGAFRAAALGDLGAHFIEFGRYQSPLTPEITYAAPWFTVVAPGEFMSVLFDKFQLWLPTAGSSGPYAEYLYPTVITAENGYNGFVIYQSELMRWPTYNWMFMCYQIGGHTDDTATVKNPTKAKIIVYTEAGGISSEFNSASLPIVLKRYSVLPTPFVRNLYNSDLLADDERVRKTFMYLHDATTYSGTLYEAVDVEGTFGLAAVALPALPAGSRTTNRYTDHVYDVFSSIEAQHYYVVVFTSDVAVVPQAGSYGVNIGFYSTTSLRVEKRKKTDWSLVETYNLTPSAIDRELQGLPVDAQILNCDSGTAVEASINELLTRFIPVGSDTSVVAPNGVVSGVAPKTIGTVLVKGGVEYPLYPVTVITQDYLDFSTAAKRQGYIETPTPEYVTANGGKIGTLAQAALLWLEAPGTAGGKRWSGVDAVGLSITTSSDGNSIVKNIGHFQAWTREPISDGKTMWHQLESYPSERAGLFFLSRIKDANNIGEVRYANQPAYIICDCSTYIIAGDKFYVELTDAVNDENNVKLVYTAQSGNTDIDVLNYFIGAINATGKYSATDSPRPSDYPSGSAVKIEVPQSGYVTLLCVPERPSTCNSVYDYIISAKVVNAEPVVNLDVIRSHDILPFWFEL